MCKEGAFKEPSKENLKEQHRLTVGWLACDIQESGRNDDASLVPSPAGTGPGNLMVAMKSKDHLLMTFSHLGEGWPFCSV